MQLKPIYDKIVVKIDNTQEIKSSEGIVLNRNMNQSNHTVCKGTVIGIGQGRLLADGTVKPLIVSVGDQVLYPKMQGESYNDGINDYCILSEQSILCVLEESNENN